MKILSINIRGLKKEGKVAWARELISKTNPVITVLQETMCRKVSDRWIENIWGSNSVRYAVKSSIGRSGGLVTIWDSNVFMFTQALEGKFFLAIRGSLVGYDSEIVTANIYGPHNDEKKKRFWCSLGDLLQMTNVEWILCGDFNELRNVGERLNTRYNAKRASVFNEFINDNGLIEISLVGKRFTRISDDDTQFSKLDRFLVRIRFFSYGTISRLFH
ncbi:uncharacterized protein [Rutidosis leptorrhynchoides]|uniref:uncharacterized protein n=1 Tax=Rutidosis leptorrhynchoides TaxID=125765 RepID=UPI003A993CE8